jgi:hypothetical protein
MKTKNAILSLAVILFMAVNVMAQDLIQYPAPKLKFKIKQSGGKNGAAVAYNPEKQLYYCVMAGNADYPLETFYENGSQVYQASASNDMRGMWWNPKAKTLEGNCYSDGGIVSIGLTPDGFAGNGNRVIFAGSNYQPSEHACGVIDSKGKEILYYSDGMVTGYNRKDGKPSNTYVILSLPVDEEDINWTSLIYTGVKGMEFGVLDSYAGKVYLFDRKYGFLTGTVILPKSAAVYEAFNFSYANGYVFLFDQDEREWTGYRIF